LACILVISAAASAISVSEDFDSIGGATSNGQQAGANLEAAGWFFLNDSNSRGITDWFQGNTGVVSPQATAGYIAANFNNTTEVGTISNWMMLPAETLQNGDVLSFYTRTAGDAPFADRLQVRMSLNGVSTDPNDFTTLLLDVNPTYEPVGYPAEWTQFGVTLSGVGTATSGRLGLRYFVENGGPSGENSNYIGVDTLRFASAGPSTPVPEPLTFAGAVIGISSAGAYLRRRAKAAA
jgi:hypothetical protein